MKNEHVLFVDDDPQIVLTMPQILRRQGYRVTAAATVDEALAHIASEHFDVLISDLNIDRQGDGMEVVAAMRRTQPGCLTVILTGDPGFDSALEAMRHQVDEYLVKPALVGTLIDLLEQRLAERRRASQAPGKRIHQVLRENMFEIIQRALRAIHKDIRLGSLPLSDEERIEFIPQVIEYQSALLEAADPREIEQVTLRHAELHGTRRYQQGYTIPLLAAYSRHLERAMLDVIHDHQTGLDPAHFMFDLKRLDSSLGRQLEHTLQAYLEAQQQGGRASAQQPSAS